MMARIFFYKHKVIIISTPNNKLYEKIIYNYLNSKFENGDVSFKPTNPNRGSFPPEM